MYVYVTVHVDLRPEADRHQFNHQMENAGWSKVPDIFTLWHRDFETATFDAAREKAISSVRNAATSAVVTLMGAVIAGNTAPVQFDAAPAPVSDVSWSEILRLSGK